MDLDVEALEKHYNFGRSLCVLGTVHEGILVIRFRDLRNSEIQKLRGDDRVTGTTGLVKEALSDIILSASEIEDLVARELQMKENLVAPTPQPAYSEGLYKDHQQSRMFLITFYPWLSTLRLVVIMMLDLEAASTDLRFNNVQRLKTADTMVVTSESWLQIAYRCPNHNDANFDMRDHQSTIRELSQSVCHRVILAMIGGPALLLGPISAI